MKIDIGNFYLNTLLLIYKYMNLNLTDIPQEVIDKYKLRQKTTKDGYVYIEVRKGMYGLPQAELLAQQQALDAANGPAMPRHVWS